MNHAGHPAFIDQMPPFSTYMGRMESSAPRMFPNLPPFQKDIIGHYYEERSAFAHAMHGPGVPPFGLERMPPVPWASQVSCLFTLASQCNFLVLCIGIHWVPLKP